uniref:Uncharacterized protein n=1 Tax=Strigamia maritima TaxID=126957 RepID=T1IN82_STRMM
MERGEGVKDTCGNIGKRERVARRIVVFLQRLWFPPRPVFVVRMIPHVLRPQSFGFIDEGSFVGFGKKFPLRSESFADLRIVHLGIFLRNFLPLQPRPDHKCVHRTFHVLRRFGHGCAID